MSLGWVSVNSSNVDAIAYDSSTLYVRFHVKKRGQIVGTRTWMYDDVPVEVYIDMINADSKGKFVWSHLRDKFTCREI